MPIRPEDFATGGALLGGIAASLLRDHARLPQPGQRIGPFRITEELGRGGMAVVYRAARDDGEYLQTVALKWIAGGGGDEGARALFRRERQALADLNHPHIARLLDGGHGEDGQPWLAMEYVDGARIDRHARAAQLDTRARLSLYLQVCEAAAYAHARGLLHRDIKPSNVLVNAAGQAKLLDFGIVQLIGEDDTLARHAHTPGYASPEQERGERLTVAADVYQLGRLLQRLLADTEQTAEALTRASALHAAAAPASAQAQLQAQVQAAIGLPRALGALIQRATDAEPGRRYATVEALIDDVRAFLAQRPLQAMGGGAGYRLRCFLARHRWSALALTLGLLSLAALTLSSAQRIRAERDAASYQARVATAALSFLTEDMLAAASPEEGMGRELSVRDALDRAAESVEQRFADAPLEHLTVRRALAELYHRLGRLQESERELERALALSAQVAGEDGERARRETLRQRAWLDLDRAETDRLQAYLQSFDPLAEATAATSRARRGEAEVRDQVDLQLLRAGLEQQRGEYAAAEAQAAQALALAQQALGADDRLSVQAQAARAEALRMLGQHQAAIELLESVRRSYAERLGELHPLTLAAEQDLGVVLRHAGRFEESLAALQGALSKARTVLGAEHPRSLRLASETATVLQELKRFEEAEPLFVQALQGRLAALGEQHVNTRNSMSNLGLLYALWGRLEQAAPMYERVLALELDALGEEHPDTLALMHNIAGLYRRQQRYDEALQMHTRAIDGASRRLGERAWQTGMFEAGRALTRQASGDFDGAESDFRLAIEALSENLGAEHARTLRAVEMREAMRAERAAAAAR